MSAFAGLTINGKFYSRGWLVENFGSLAPAGFSDTEFRTLTFCGRWLAGDDEFPIETSGSTGSPRTTIVTRQQMTLSARMTAEAIGLQAGQRALVCLSSNYIAGLMMLVRSMVLGLELTVVEPASNPFLTLPDDLRFDFTALAPMQLQAILAATAAHRAILSKMKAVLVGGAPMPFSLEQAVQSIQAPVYHTFGMTETVSHIALRRVNGSARSEDYTVLAGVQIGQDERGCLTIRSALAGKDAIVTNDIVKLTSDRSFLWLGRFDNIINSGGVKVQPEKIEQAMARVFASGDFAELAQRAFFVAGLPDEQLGEKVVVIMEGEAVDANVQAGMRHRLDEMLSPFELPKRFYGLSRFIRTRTGKIDRRQTLELLQRQLD